MKLELEARQSKRKEKEGKTADESPESSAESGKKYKSDGQESPE